MSRLSLSVVVVTLNRAACLRTCLERLAAQRDAICQVVVVDASTDPDQRERTRAAVEAHRRAGPTVYLRNESGYGHMTESRNIGLKEAIGDVIAFLDDDAFAQPGWAVELLRPYAGGDGIGGVGGRVVRRPEQLGEPPAPDATNVGILRRDGMIGGQWERDFTRELDVEHMMGCNMSFRREVLAQLGGFRDEFPGPELREETDMCFRVRRLGYRLVHTPRAAVVHVGSEKPVGRRFDVTYEYYARHNHTYLLARNFGPSGILFRYLLASTRMDAVACARAAVRGGPSGCRTALTTLAAAHAGKAMGLARGLRKYGRSGLDPVRRDALGRSLTAVLARREGAAQPAQEHGSVALGDVAAAAGV